MLTGASRVPVKNTKKGSYKLKMTLFFYGLITQFLIQ